MSDLGFEKGIGLLLSVVQGLGLGLELGIGVDNTVVLSIVSLKYTVPVEYNAC
jgi:hypothetical protein